MFKTRPFLLKISFVHQLFCDSFLFLLCSKEKSVGFGSDSADSSLFLSRFSYIGLRTTDGIELDCNIKKVLRYCELNRKSGKNLSNKV